MAPKIGIYVQTNYTKKTGKSDFFDKRIFPGLMIVCNELKSNKIQYEYCSMATAHKHAIVLVSITSQCDWASFLYEKNKWTKSKSIIIAGGFGVINPLLFLSDVDFFYLGRAENDIAEMITELQNGNYTDREHVIESKTYSSKKIYKIRQVKKPYGEIQKKQGVASICESVIGCQRKCLFCSFSWHRRYCGDGLQKDSGIFAGDAEKTMFEILKGNHSNLSALRMVGLDGVSERIRKIVNKPILENDVISLAKILSQKAKPHHVKLYNIVGYGFEKDCDYESFAETIIKCDEAMETGKFAFEIHSTPFRPMPATPMACQPTKYFNFRKQIASKLRKYTKYQSQNSVFYNGKNLFALETMGTESLSTVILDMVVLRGTEKDADSFKKVSISNNFLKATTKQKINTLEKLFDVKKIFGIYTPTDLPTKNIKTYCDINYDYFNSLIDRKTKIL